MVIGIAVALVVIAALIVYSAALYNELVGLRESVKVAGEHRRPAEAAS